MRDNPIGPKVQHVLAERRKPRAGLSHTWWYRLCDLFDCGPLARERKEQNKRHFLAMRAYHEDQTRKAMLRRNPDYMI